MPLNETRLGFKMKFLKEKDKQCDARCKDENDFAHMLVSPVDDVYRGDQIKLIKVSKINPQDMFEGKGLLKGESSSLGKLTTAKNHRQKCNFRLILHSPTNSLSDVHIHNCIDFSGCETIMMRHLDYGI